MPLLKASHIGGRFRYRRQDGSIGSHVDFIADAIGTVRNAFPNSLLHVFGAGGVPTVLALFAAGADLRLGRMASQGKLRGNPASRHKRQVPSEPSAQSGPRATRGRRQGPGRHRRMLLPSLQSAHNRGVPPRVVGQELFGARGAQRPCGHDRDRIAAHRGARSP